MVLRLHDLSPDTTKEEAGKVAKKIASAMAALLHGFARTLSPS
jgi:hypothetical protein